MEFTVAMLQRAMVRWSRTDQIDRQIISLASGVPYRELGEMTQREFNTEYYDLLKAEVVPYIISLSWDSGVKQWRAVKCSCRCECGDCTFFFECLPCECGGELLAAFREVLQNDIEMMNATKNPSYVETCGVGVSRLRP